MTAWLGVVAAQHVQRGVELGIAQFNHGKRNGLDRIRAGDALVYYSPTEILREPPPLRAFTALGTFVGDEVYQGQIDDARPWRRDVEYDLTVHRVAVAELPDLDLTSGPNWGYQLRRGLLPLSDNDFRRIAAAMHS